MPKLKLPACDAWIANAILNTLRDWERQHGPGVWIVTLEDVEHLAMWAAHLQETHEQTRQRLDADHIEYELLPQLVR